MNALCILVSLVSVISAACVIVYTITRRGPLSSFDHLTLDEFDALVNKELARRDLERV